MKRFRQLALMLAILGVFAIAGCGSSGDDVISTGGGGQVAQPTGNVQVNFQLLRAIPATVDTIQFFGLDSAGNQVFSSTNAKAATITLTGVPTSVVTLNFNLLQGGVVVGTGSVTVSVSAGQTTVVNDPNFSDVTPTPSPSPTGTPTPSPAPPLGATYILSGADASPGTTGSVSGNLVVSDNGTVVSGQLVRAGQTFTVTGGTITQEAARYISGQINTDLGNFELVRGRQSLTGKIGMLLATVGHESFAQPTANYMTILAQKSGSGRSNASLSGSYPSVIMDTTFPPTVYFGNLNYNGAGAVSGTLDQNGTSVTAQGTYSVADTGLVTGSISINGSSFPITGSVGDDGTLAASGDNRFVYGSPEPSVPCTLNDFGTNTNMNGWRIAEGNFSGIFEVAPGTTTLTGSIRLFNKVFNEIPHPLFSLTSGTINVNGCALVGSFSTRAVRKDGIGSNREVFDTNPILFGAIGADRSVSIMVNASQSANNNLAPVIVLFGVR